MKKGIPVNTDNAWDKAVIRLGELGFTAETISKETGLTTYQVQYRRFKLNCGPMRYRRGETSAAKIILASLRRDLRAIEKLKAFTNTH